MTDLKVTRYFLIGLLLVFLYLAALTVMPVMKNIIIALVLVFAFYPAYSSLRRIFKSSNLSSFIMILLLFLLIIIPSGFIVNSLIKQTYSAYSLVKDFDFGSADSLIPSFIAERIDIGLYIDDMVFKIRNFIVAFAPDLIGSVAEIVLGLFVMFFVMFYAFRDGRHWINKLESSLPMKKEYTKKLLSNTESITKAVLYGYVLTAVIQGFLGGLIFLVLGISNPVFWGFIMIILAIIPLLGTPIIWGPAIIMLLFTGHYFKGFFLLAFGVLILINIDNFLRPKLIGQKAKVHPVIVLVGVIGGLAMFGFTGIILGPLILTLLIVIAKFAALEFEY